MITMPQYFENVFKLVEIKPYSVMQKYCLLNQSWYKREVKKEEFHLRSKISTEVLFGWIENHT